MMMIFLLLALGVIFLVGSMIALWYVFIFGFTLLAIMGGLVYWLTLMLVDGLTNNMELAQTMGIAAAVVTLLSVFFWAHRSGK